MTGVKLAEITSQSRPSLTSSSAVDVSSESGYQDDENIQKETIFDRRT